MKNNKKVFFRHKVVYALLRPIFKLYNYLAYGYRCEKYNLKENQPYLILANHNSNFDPFFLAQSFNKVIYFVASDHIFRWGFISKIIEYLVSPIPIAKSQVDLKCIKNMKSIVAEGGTVGIFPSGNKSFNGTSPAISTAIVKLIKSLKVPIILYMIEGMYFSTPRWADKKRKGKTRGYVVRELSVDEISKLSNEELSIILTKCLYENAYEVQEKNMVEYKGKNLAQSLERVLYICPHCKSICNMESKGDYFTCTCGYMLTYDKYGFFKSDGKYDLVINNILDWDRWQKHYLKSLYLDNKLFVNNEPIYIDKNESLYSCIKAANNTLIGYGELSMYQDRIEFSSQNNKIIFYLDDITKIICHSAQVIQLTIDNKNMYEIKSDKPRSATKYVHMYNLIKYGEGSVEFNGI